MKNIEELSGLELLRSYVSGERPHPSICETMPMQMVEINEGCVLFRVKANRNHLNPMGTVHGGFSATVLDSVTGCAVHTTLKMGESYATIDLNIKLLKGVPEDRDLWAEGRIISLSKRIGVSEGTLKDDTGVLYSHATATCIIKR